MSRLLFPHLRCCASSLLPLVLLATVAPSALAGMAKPQFLLSCRVIGGICQGDMTCLEEMSARFPDCYLEGQFDLLPPSSKSSEPLIGGGGPFGPEIRRPMPMDKRGMKLMKVLMMKDRIPVGRR